MANSIPCCIRQSITSMTAEVILPLCLAVATHLQCWIQVWTPRYKRDRDLSEGHEVSEGPGASDI